MGTPPTPAPRVLFGPFEYDGSSGELRKHQTKLRLTGQPLQILDVLLGRANEVVGREELQQRLWKQTTFVDFEHGLNAAINKLRQTLGDSADQPRYVETLPGRGYRFIGAVTYSPSRPVLEVVAPIPSQPAVDRPEELPAPPWRASPTGFRRSRVAVLIALVVVAVAGVWLALKINRPPLLAIPNAEAMRFRIAIPEGMKLGESQTFSISPDGRTLVYLARSDGAGPLRLWAQSLDALEPRILETPLSDSDAPVLWSPDSKFLAFHSEGRLKKIDLSGNPAQVIARVPGTVLGGSWNREGTLIFGSETGGIMRLGATGGEPVPVTSRNQSRGERVHLFPTFLPDGRHFLYSRQSSVAANTGIFVGSLAAKPEEQSLAMLAATPIAPQFVATPDGNGLVLFQRETTLWAQGFDASALQLRGAPQRVAEPVGSNRAFGFFSSSSGTLVHRNALTEVGQLTWFNRREQRLAKVGQPADFWGLSPKISPDGTRVAVTKFEGGNVDVWVHDLSRDVSQRITLDPAIDQWPVWSPDGKRIVFSSSAAGHYDLYVIGASGESRELLYASGENKIATSWSADGRFLLYNTEVGSAKPGIYVLPMDGAGKRLPIPLRETSANERDGVFSPDSQWIAYVSSASGQPEVYVQPFTPPTGPEDGPKVLLSRGGGFMPHWRGDGKELFYRAVDGVLMSVAISLPAAPHPGVPKRLFHLDGTSWDATGDGNHFLVILPLVQRVPPFTAVLNWQAEFKK